MAAPLENAAIFKTLPKAEPMRYRKGHIHLNHERDLPLLRQVVHSRFITHTQLCEFALLHGLETSRRSFHWRVGRLVDSGLVGNTQGVLRRDCPVYAIKKSGIDYLIENGEFYLPNALTAEKDRQRRNLGHSLGLNEIQLTLLRAGVLANWTSELEIRSRNLLGSGGLLKDYDAFVDIVIDEHRACFALEYECSMKGYRQYARVRQMLDAEQSDVPVLYLVPNYTFLGSIAPLFAGTRRRTYFCTYPNFKAQVLHATVLAPDGIHAYELREVLRSSVGESPQQGLA